MKSPTLLTLTLTLTLLLAAAPSSAAWPTDPALNLAIADRAGEQVVPKIAVAPDGRTYVAWFDNAAGSYDVYLQHLDAAGNEVWPHNGIVVSSHAQSTSLVGWDLIVDSQGNAVVTFTDTRDGGDLDVFAYRIDAAGTFLWGANGVQLSFNSDYEPSPTVCEASDGDFVFVWPWLPNGDGALEMQRLSPAGAPRFAVGGISIASAPGESPAFCQVLPGDAASVLVGYVRDIDTFAAPRRATSGWCAYPRPVRLSGDRSPFSTRPRFRSPIFRRCRATATAGPSSGGTGASRTSSTPACSMSRAPAPSCGDTTASPSRPWSVAITSIRPARSTPNRAPPTASGMRRRPIRTSGASAGRGFWPTARATGARTASPSFRCARRSAPRHEAPGPVSPSPRQSPRSSTPSNPPAPSETNASTLSAPRSTAPPTGAPSTSPLPSAPSHACPSPSTSQAPSASSGKTTATAHPMCTDRRSASTGPWAPRRPMRRKTPTGWSRSRPPASPRGRIRFGCRPASPFRALRRRSTSPMQLAASCDGS